MLPSLFTIGPFTLHTYGLMLILGFLAGINLGAKRAKARGEDPNFIWDLAVYVILASIVGARALYVILNWSEYRDNPLSAVNPIQPDGSLGIGGLVYIGGLIAAVITAVFTIKRRKKDVLKILDICVPCAAIGLGIGRLGCFFAGCCYGLPSDLPWSMHFPAGCPAGDYQGAVHAFALHPSQLYMVFGDITVGLLLLLFERIRRFDGSSLFLFVMLYGLDRSVVDFFRFYPASELHRGFTHNQIILACASAVSLALFIRGWIKSAKSAT